MTCAHCHTPIEPNEKGRPRKFCSDICKRLAAHSKPYTLKCSWPPCKSKVVRGKRGKPAKFCSERCKRLAYYYPGRM